MTNIAKWWDVALTIVLLIIYVTALQYLPMRAVFPIIYSIFLSVLLARVLRSGRYGGILNNRNLDRISNPRGYWGTVSIHVVAIVGLVATIPLI